MEKELKQYINKIYRGVQLPRKIKKQIKLELTSEIYSRMEDGETLSDILISIGSPWEVISDLESNYGVEYSHFKKEKILAFAILSVIAVCMAVLIISSISSAAGMLYPDFAPSTVIGGADGSTSIFVAFKWSSAQIFIGMVLKVVILLFSIFQMMKLYRSLRKNKGR